MGQLMSYDVSSAVNTNTVCDMLSAELLICILLMAHFFCFLYLNNYENQSPSQSIKGGFLG